MRYVLPIIYIMLPFAFLSKGLIHIGQHYAFYIASGVLFGTMLYGGFPEIKNKYIGVFFIYLSILVLAMCALNMLGFARVIHVKSSIVTLFYFTSAVVVYIAVTGSKLKSETFYNAICISALIQVVIVVFQYFRIYPVVYLISKIVRVEHFKDFGGIVSGTLGNVNFVMAYIVMSTPFFFRKRWVYCLGLIVPIVVLSKVSFAFMSLAVGIAVFYNKGAKWIITGCVIGLLYALWSDLEKIINGERVIMWQKCIKEFTCWPNVLFGFGPFSEWKGRVPLHNEYLASIHRFGIVGLAVIIGFINDKIKHFNFFGIITGNKILYSAMAITLTNSIGNPTLHFAPTLVLIIFIFGLIEREQYGRLPNLS